VIEPLIPFSLGNSKGRENVESKSYSIAHSVDQNLQFLIDNIEVAACDVLVICGTMYARRPYTQQYT
jgi:hypothetical protein